MTDLFDQKRKKSGFKFLFICFLFTMIIHLPIWGEEIDFSRAYFADLAGYHAVGSHVSENKDEAFRLAKAEAIKLIFGKIGKDELFQRMFISIMPHFIIVEGSKEEEKNKKFTVTLRIKIDQNAVILVEQRYIQAVGELLNEADKLLDESVAAITDAEQAELNLRMSEAMIHYRSAVIRCEEIQELIKNITDTSITSDGGNNIILIGTTMKNYSSRAKAGFVRLEKLEEESEKDAALAERLKTFDLLLAELNGVKKIITDYGADQPFFDMPKSDLEKIKLDVLTGLKKSELIKEKLAFLVEQIPENRYLLKEKVGITIEDLKSLERRLKKMEKDVVLEIQDPRMARQAREQDFREFQKGLGDFFTYLVTHSPEDILAVRFYIPFQVDVNKAPGLVEDGKFYIRAEKAFDNGLWVKTQFTTQTTEMLNGLLSDTIGQEFSVGYFGYDLLFGLGVGWQWGHSIGTKQSPNNNAIKNISGKVYFGGIDLDRMRAEWLLSFKYEVPSGFHAGLLANLLNLEAELILRAEDILILETTFSTNQYQSQVYSGDALPDYYEYQFSWDAGAAIRFPGPFTWGIYHNFNWRSSETITNGWDSYWSLFAEYSF